MKDSNTLKNKLNNVNTDIVDKKGIDNVVDVLRSGFLSKPEGGKYVGLFQEEFSKWIDKKYCFATTSGTTSLHGAIAALDLKKGDEVLVPALANIADASVLVQEGLIPVFVDISKEDFNIDPQEIIKNISAKTKAIIVVHMYGQPVKIDEIKKIASEKKLILIEDCAQAAGAIHNGNRVGSFGDISCFSFYQTKHIICGEGGLIATNNEHYAKILRSILNNGIKHDNLDDYEYDRIGFNYQMTEIQAALGLAQLARQADLNKKRRKHAATYRDVLRDTEIFFQHENNDTENVYFYLTGILPKGFPATRDEFMNEIRAHGIPIKKLYPSSLPEVEIIQKLFNTDPDKTPIAKDLTKRVFNLYVNPSFSDSEIMKYAEGVKNVYLKFTRK